MSPACKYNIKEELLLRSSNNTSHAHFCWVVGAVNLNRHMRWPVTLLVFFLPCGPARKHSSTSAGPCESSVPRTLALT